MAEYNYYMKQVNTDDNTEYDLKQKFPTFNMKRMDGLMVKGDPKNFYTESFPETSKINVYAGTPASKSGKISMYVLFYGPNCADDFDAFVSFVDGNIIEYRDTYRGKTVTMYMSKAIKVTSDVRREDYSYIEATLTFQNINK